MSTTNENWREEYVRRVRNVGESLIKNAESIVGTEEYFSFLRISVDFERDGADQICVNRRFYPERLFETNKDNAKKNERKDHEPIKCVDRGYWFGHKEK